MYFHCTKYSYELHYIKNVHTITITKNMYIFHKLFLHIKHAQNQTIFKHVKKIAKF